MNWFYAEFINKKFKNPDKSNFFFSFHNST